MKYLRLIRLVMSGIVVVVSSLSIIDLIAAPLAMSIALPLLGIVNILYGVDYYMQGRKKRCYAYSGLGAVIILLFIFELLF